MHSLLDSLHIAQIKMLDGKTRLRNYRPIRHALGFYHEHTRPDRDDYITILPENVRKGESHDGIKH